MQIAFKYHMYEHNPVDGMNGDMDWFLQYTMVLRRIHNNINVQW